MKSGNTGLSIGAKTALLLSVFTTFTAGSVGILVYLQLDAHVVEGTLGHIRSEARQVALLFEQQLQTLGEDARWLAGSEPVRGIVRCRQNGGVDPVGGSTEAAWRHRLNVNIGHLMRVKPRYPRVRFIDAQGRQIVRLEAGAEGPVAAGTQMPGRQAHHPDVRDALKRGPDTVSLSSVERDRDHGRVPVIRASASVPRPGGGTFGAVTITLDLSAVVGKASSILAEGQSLRVVDERGGFVAHPNPDHAFSREKDEPFGLQDEWPQLARALKAGETTFSSIMTDARSDAQVFGLAKAHFDPTHPDRFCTFVVSAPYEKAAAAALIARDTSVLLGAALTAVAVFVGVLVSLNLTRPIRQMTAGVEAFEKQGRAGPLPVGARDELGVLARSLRGMFEMVQEKAAALKVENERRRGAQEAAEKAERNLARYARDLADSNDDLEQFAYVASHDLQEPLRKIQSFGDILRSDYRSALGEEGGDMIERMHRAATRMRTLIDDLLAYSRVISRAKSLERVDLNAIASEVVDDLQVTLAESQGRIELGDLPAIEADPAQMRHMLQNLLTNALKFRHEDRPPVVRVRGEIVPHPAEGDLHLEQAPGGRVCVLEIRDNGIGFDMQYKDRIFGPFQRLHGQGRYEGSGIGLAIVRKIVARHHGRIEVDSKPGQGATFTLILPAVQPSGESQS